MYLLTAVLGGLLLLAAPSVDTQSQRPYYPTLSGSIRGIFSRFDQDKAGCGLSKEEGAQMFDFDYKSSPEEIQQMYDQREAFLNGKYQVSFEPFSELILEVFGKSEFMSADQNRDNAVNVTELSSYLRAVNRPVRAKYATQFIRLVDEDDSKDLNSTEFTRLMIPITYRPPRWQ